MNDFGFDLKEYANNRNSCTSYLSGILNRGKLGLYLGSGASRALGLPNWKQLVKNCLLKLGAGRIDIPADDNFDPKLYSGKFKKACASQDEYLAILHESLYKGVSFDFLGIKKEMLIALTSLMVGKVRGNVNKVITLNFDDVLEWYLETNGLRVHVTDYAPLESQQFDVEILHLHGILPFSEKRQKTDTVIFTEDEFLVRERGKAYIKTLVEEFYKNHIFLGVGLSPETVTNDIVPYMMTLSEEWYKNDVNNRGYPYGVVFLSDCSQEQADKMLDSGIIPCIFTNLDEIPTAIFEIAQKSAVIL